MKFIETLNGSFVNINEIIKIDHEEINNRWYSFIYLKDGQKLDFIDCPDSFTDSKQNKHIFDGDHLITLHRYACELIVMLDFVVISQDKLDEYVWNEFSKDIEKLITEKIA